jgi:RNA polymerase primary sigma factor
MIAVSPKRSTRKSPRGIPRELRERAEQVLALDYPYMDTPQFRRKSFENGLFGPGCDPVLPDTSWYQPTFEDLEKEMTNSPKLMTSAEERLMFYRFNFSKRRLMQIKRKVALETLTRELAEEAVKWHDRYELYREYLTRTNLALVLAMAKRTRLGQVDFAEIVSEGNMALLRAVEKFDVERGFKFSTYACRAILKAFSRTSLKQNRYRNRFPVEFEPDLERSDWSDRRRETHETECIDELKNIVDRNLAELTQVEQTVIRQRFNWREQQTSPLTLEEVGQIIGVTKERVRQIQNKALAKIRQVMEDGVLRTVPGEENSSTLEPVAA